MNLAAMSSPAAAVTRRVRLVGSGSGIDPTSSPRAGVVTKPTPITIKDIDTIRSLLIVNISFFDTIRESEVMLSWCTHSPLQ